MLDKINISLRKQKLIVYIVLTIVTLAVFWQVHQYDFINYDDPVYVTENSHIQSGISQSGFLWAFRTTDADLLWHPLIWLSFMSDYQLFGLNAGGYHITNLILHILSALLLFWLFNRMTRAIWKSAFVAVLFALHPLHVESVAWISERKDVLSVFLWILTLCFYVYYTEKPAIRRYLSVLFCFICALMSKPMVVTLPVVMILLDYWPLGRLESRKANLFLWQLKEKMPFLILTAVFSITTIYTQYDPSIKYFSFGLRITNASVSFATYLEQTFWPHDMAVFYPFPAQIPLWQVLAAILLILIISGAVIVAAKRLPYLFVGWLWYTITILPVIGIIQSGEQAMADRYHYLPSIGIAIGLAWGVPLLIKNKVLRKNILFPVSIASIAILSVLTWQQCGYWKDSIELFNYALQVTEDNYLAHINLAVALQDGKTKEALYHYNEAIRIMPDYMLSARGHIIYNNRGNAYVELGQYQLAFEDFDKSILLKPDFANTYNSRGEAYAKLGQYQRAFEDFNKSILLKPDYADSYYFRGRAYANVGLYQSALEDFNEAVRLKPDDADYFNNRGGAYIKLGQYQRAIKDFNKIILLDSNFFKAYNNKGFVYANLGQYKLAIEDFNKVITLKEDYAEAYNSRAAIYLNQGNKDAGCFNAKKACTLGICRTLEAARIKGICR